MSSKQERASSYNPRKVYVSRGEQARKRSRPRKEREAQVRGQGQKWMGCLKDTIKEEERQPIEWKKISAQDFDKRVYKKILECNYKKTANLVEN